MPFLDVYYALELSAAAEAGHDDANAYPYAFELIRSLRANGRTDVASDLLAAVRTHFPEPGQHLPHALYYEADLARDRGRLSQALTEIEAAEVAAQSSADPLLLQRIHAVRMQTYSDMGLLHLAFEAYRDFRLEADRATAVNEAEIERITSTLEPDEAAPPGLQALLYNRILLRLYPDQHGCTLELTRRRHAEAVAHMDALLADEELIALYGAQREWFELRLLLTRGIARRLQARDEAARGDSAYAEELLIGAADDLSYVLDRDLDEAIGVGMLTVEEALKGLLARVDVAWLESDLDAAEDDFERLDALLEGRAAGARAEDMARLAALRARHLLGGKPSKSELRSALARLEAAYGQVERDWLAAERMPGGLGFLHWDVQTMVLATWIDLLLALDAEGGPRDALHVVARAQALATLARRIGGAELTKDAARLTDSFLAGLPDESGVVVFLPSLDDTHVLAADRHGVVWGRAPSRRVLEELGRRLVLDTGREPQGDLEGRKRRIAASATALAEELFPDAVAARVTKWRRVAFAGSELFGGPPLEVLALDGESLGSTHATSYLPGLPLAALLAEHWPEARPEAKSVIIAGPHRPGDLALPLEAQVLDQLKRLAAGGLLRTGGDAHLQGVSFADTSTLSLVAHGSYDASRERPALVALASYAPDADGLLDCSALESYGEAGGLPPLVLFFTCKAAIGPVARGDTGATHLGGAALLGGAGAVLLAPNDISLEAALHIQEALLERLRAGDSPDEALRRARTAVAAIPELSDPFYHSSLRLFGVGHRPLVP
ncbi:MAG: CHAT domain-containing protein [Planctomycetota bacterium]